MSLSFSLSPFLVSSRGLPGQLSPLFTPVSSSSSSCTNALSWPRTGPQKDEREGRTSFVHRLLCLHKGLVVIRRSPEAQASLISVRKREKRTSSSCHQRDIWWYSIHTHGNVHDYGLRVWGAGAISYTHFTVAATAVVVANVAARCCVRAAIVAVVLKC